MRKGVVYAAVGAGFALMLGFLCLLLLAFTGALADGWRLREAAAHTHDSSPRFSPDGRRIAFLRGAKVWVMADDGSDQRPVGAAKRFAWTPRGALVLGRAPHDAGSARSRGRLVFVRDHKLWLRVHGGGEVELT